MEEGGLLSHGPCEFLHATSYGAQSRSVLQSPPLLPSWLTHQHCSFFAETKDDLEYVFPIEFLYFINNNANMTIPITLNPSSIPKILFKTNKNCK